jgi:hypothetical protein
VSYGGQAGDDLPIFGPKWAVIEPRFKLIQTPGLEQIELFDLQADPAERQNLATQHPEEAERLRALAEETLEMTPTESEPMSPALLEKLRALGYVQ